MKRSRFALSIRAQLLLVLMVFLVLPWLGVMAWGLAAGRVLLARAPALLRGRLPALARPLAMLGRWSLSFYMLHQPVLIGLLMAWIALRR